jgi:hypothetical protein
MNPDDQRKCARVTDFLFENHLSYWFREPVDPTSEGAKNYYQSIAKPMDLSSVRSNLERGAYSNVAEWQADVNLIWDNALSYNPANSVWAYSATTLKKVFTKEMSVFFLTPEERWAKRSADLLKKLIALDKVEAG